MKSLNKVLIIFFAVIGITFYVAWEIIQSEYVAGILTKTITRVTEQKLGAKLKFERIQFDLFPPGVYIENVEFNSITEDYVYSSYLGSVGISFDLLDVFKTKFTLSDIYLNDGRLNIKKISTSKETENNKPPKVSEILDTINKKIPVRLNRVTLNQIHLDVVGFKVTTENAVAIISKDKLGVNLRLQSFDLEKLGLYSEVVDNLEIYSVIDDEKIKIYEMNIDKGLNSIVLEGEIKDYQSVETAKADLQGKLKFYLDDLHKYLAFRDIGSIEQGFASVDFGLNGTWSKFESTVKVDVQDLLSDFVKGESVNMALSVNQDRIRISDFSLSDGKGSIKLLKSFELFNIKSKKFVEEKISVTAEKMPLTNALRFFRSTLSPIKGLLSANVDFTLNENDYHFDIKDSAKIESLQVDINKEKLLGANNITLGSSGVHVDRSKVDMEFNLKGNKVSGKIVGQIKDSITTFVSSDLSVDLNYLGPFSGFKIAGQTDAKIDVLLSDSISQLKISPSVQDFDFEGYRLDRLKGAILFDFNKSSIAFSEIKGRMGDSEIGANGEISLDSLELNAKINHDTLYWKDLVKIYAPLLGTLDFMPPSTFGNWKTNYNISGKATLDDLKLNGSFSGTNNILFNEGFDQIGFSYYLEEQKLKFLNVKAIKSTGNIFGGYTFDLKTQEQYFWGNIVKVPLKELNHLKKLPLNVEGLINGVLKGTINNDGKNGKMEMTIDNTIVQNEPVEDSYLLVTLEKDKVDINMTLFGKQIENYSSISLEKDGRSSITTKVDIPSMEKLLNAFSFVEGRNKFQGQLEAESLITFQNGQFNKADMSVNLKKLLLDREKVRLSYSNADEEITVRDGLVKKWDLSAIGSNIYIVSRGSGTFYESLDINTKVSTSAEVFEVFNGFTSNANGTVIGSVKNSVTNGEHQYKAKIVSSDLSVSSSLLPLTFSRGDILINFTDNNLQFKRFKADINSGKLDIGGNINLSKVIPDVDLNYSFRSAGITILKKSELVFSGEGLLRGKTFPYSLSGDIEIENLLISNEITDFGGGSQIVEKDIDYLPKNIKKSQNQLLNFDVDITTTEPIKVVNSMANLGFIGAVRLSGGEKDPKLSGKFELAPQKNQLFFKNNIFNLTKGNIFFYRQNEISNPELDFEATSTINDYAINIRVFDFVNNFKLDMTSDPSLVKSDILSLIAFGYTEDISSNLSDEERESMTRAGVGSIIFDRFKINETLKNEFGLEVNLGTEITEAEQSYLTFREGRNSVGRVRSATKLEIKKQMTDQVDLSVSSTVGNSTGQKQTMNLNYNINKGVSLEGVYENRTDPEVDGNIDDTSIGADVRLKWSFK